MNDIIDIKPPVPFGLDPRWLYLALAVAVVLAAIAILVFWKRRQSASSSASVPVALPPDEEALGALLDLGQRDDLDDRQYYFRLSAILRAYLDGRFGLDTLEKTSEEAIGLLRGLVLRDEDRENLRKFFRFADPVKFASVSAGIERRQKDRMFIEDLVRTTREPGRENGRATQGRESHVPV